MARTLTLIALLAAVSSGCSYNDHFAFAGTRKLMDSEAPGITKAVFSPFTLVVDAAVSPVTCYVDAVNPRPNTRLWASFCGTQHLAEAPVHEFPTFYKYLSGVFVFPIDLALFPFTGAVDTVRVLGGANQRTHTNPQ